MTGGDYLVFVACGRCDPAD